MLPRENTPQEKELLDVIKKFQKKTGTNPTVYQIREITGRTRQRLHTMLQSLYRRGFISMQNGQNSSVVEIKEK